MVKGELHREGREGSLLVGTTNLVLDGETRPPFSHSSSLKRCRYAKGIFIARGTTS